MAFETNPRRGAVAFVVALIAAPVAGQSAVTPAETGQLASYDANSPRRDDGAIRAGVDWPTPRFTDNGNGTLTDNLTRLVWLKHVTCLPAQTWQGALSEIVQLNAGIDFSCIDYSAGSLGDWRLPNVRELESLLDASVSNHVNRLGTLGFVGVVADDFFSATTYAATWAWTLSLADGTTRTIAKSSSRQVWPVRATSAAPSPLPRTGQTQIFDTNVPARDDGALQLGVAWPAPRFGDNGDGSVDDALTGLTWLADTNCIASEHPLFDGDGVPGDGAVSWQHALDFVAEVDAGTYSACGAGRDDWRLPNRHELWSLLDASQTQPALPAGHPFVNLVDTEYWTATTWAVATDVAWTVDLWYGFPAWRTKADEMRLVWLVRGGPEIFADGFEFGDSSHWSNIVPGG